MPTNVTPEYAKAEREYHEASSIEEEIEALEKMLRELPKHKGTENLESDIKKKLSRLRDKKDKKEESGGEGYGIEIEKQGAARVVLAGPPNSGKSTILKRLTGADVEIEDYPYTTSEPEVGMLDYEGVKIQMVEIPGIVEDYDSTEHGNAFLSIARDGDLILLVYDEDDEREVLVDELKDVNVPKIDYNEDSVKDDIWENLNLIKVYTKEPRKEKSDTAVALEEGSDIEDLASEIHKRFKENFKFARIWGDSADFPRQEVGLSHELEDDDIVEFHTK